MSPKKKVSEKKEVADDKQPVAPAGKYFYAVGRRKTAVAKVHFYPAGNGEILVNQKLLDQYFSLDVWQQKVVSPLKATDTLKTASVLVKLLGGGISAQADAVRHGIARALIKFQPEFKTTLKAAGFLRRDPREKERKKYGLKKARRGPQWAKR